MNLKLIIDTYLLQVSISAGGNVMHAYGAFCVGFIAGATYIAWDIVLLHLKVDDPVTTISGNKMS